MACARLCLWIQSSLQSHTLPAHLTLLCELATGPRPALFLCLLSCSFLSLEGLVIPLVPLANTRCVLVSGQLLKNTFLYPEELKTYVHTKACTQMFIAASFIKWE